MSRVGKAPIAIKTAKIKLNGNTVLVEGPKGKLQMDLPIGIALEQTATELRVINKSDDKKSGARHGLARSLLANMVEGVQTGFVKELDIVGVGYRAAVKGQVLNLTVGYSHPVDFKLPQGVSAAVDKNTHVVLSSPDRALLGLVAAQVRAVRPPEPYQGKGIRYTNENIIRKQGKAAGSK